jgi:hypothetical protein
MRPGPFRIRRFIAMAGVSTLSQEDLRVADELRSRRKNVPLGEVAVVTGTSRNNALADLFRMLSQVDCRCSPAPPSTTPAGGSPSGALQCLAGG